MEVSRLVSVLATGFKIIAISLMQLVSELRIAICLWVGSPTRWFSIGERVWTGTGIDKGQRLNKRTGINNEEVVGYNAIDANSRCPRSSTALHCY